MFFTKPFVTKVFRSGFLLVVILFLLDIITFFYFPDTKIGEIFLATREQTPMTWVSVVVLLLIALSCANVYLKEKSLVWYFLSLVYLFFSMDDATYFHERLSGSVQELVPFMSNFPSYSWVILYLPLMIYGIGVLSYFLWKEASLREKKLILTALFVLALSLLLDMLDGWVEKSSTLVFCTEENCSLITAHFFRLFEEVLEIFGFGIFAYLNINKNSLMD